jgi:hypothetical protein
MGLSSGCGQLLRVISEFCELFATTKKQYQKKPLLTK